MYFDPRGGSNRYDVKTDFFQQWSPEMAYVLGFLYADGCVVDAKSSRTQYIEFSSKDIDILEKIKSALGSEHPIRFYPPRKITYRNGKVYENAGLFSLRIGSRRMYADLKEISLTPHKSKTITFPKDLSAEHLGNFIRGYFDGDGSIVFNKKKWIRVVFTSASKRFLEQLSEKLSAAVPIRQRPVRLGHDSYCLDYFTQEGLKVLNFIYKDASSDGLYLDRKYNLYKNISQ